MKSQLDKKQTILNQTADELLIVNQELVFQNGEKEKRAAELVIANQELAYQNEEKEKRAEELIIANRELAYQNEEKEKRAEELFIANQELAYQNEEKEKRAAELIIANEELAYQNEEKEKRAAELIIANEELAYQNEEKEKRAAELIIANEELAYQNEEKEKRAAELVIANEELAYQIKEKAKKAKELVRANSKLKQIIKESKKIAKELEDANKELVFQNNEKEQRALELAVVNDQLNATNQEIEFLANHDELTNLYSRKYFTQQLKLMNAENYYPLGIMMLDINGLKIINDAFGQKTGDQVLIRIGEILINNFWSEDIVARIGGDEFCIIIPKTSTAKLQDLKEIIVKEVKEQIIHNITLSVAIGYEVINEHANIDEIMMSVENHMYTHKSAVASSSRNDTISAILQALTDKFDIEREHSTRVSSLCVKVGKEMKIKSDELKALELAGMFHDIGKISIPDSILKKPGKLTPKEYEKIKSHTETGYQILKAADKYSDLAVHALYHHERWDGKGYPRGLHSTEIPLVSRIVGVVDSYEAMTANRPYRKKLSKEEAIKEIIRNANTQFDPVIAKILVEKVLKANWNEIEKTL